jgi:hypothetical protein
MGASCLSEQELIDLRGLGLPSPDYFSLAQNILSALPDTPEGRSRDTFFNDSDESRHMPIEDVVVAATILEIVPQDRWQRGPEGATDPEWLLWQVTAVRKDCGLV